MTENDGFGNNLVWLSVLVQRRYAQICADHDLTPVQATLLCVIKDQPQGMGELAQLLGVAKNALSGLVDRIERRGLVQRETLQRDRRAVTLSTTALGKEIVDALYADVADACPTSPAHCPPASGTARRLRRPNHRPLTVASPMPDAAPQGRQRKIAGQAAPESDRG